MKTTLKTRSDAVTLFLDTIRPLKPFYSPGRAYLHLGNTGVHYGEKSAGMEGFSRILWGLGPLWSADNSELLASQQEEIEEWLKLYQKGIICGTDPNHEEYWGDIFDFDQKMVEIAALVFAVAINRDKLWDPLAEEEQKQLYKWLNQINGFDMPKNNWRYFRILTNMLFQLLKLPCSKERLNEDFELIEQCYIGEGWYYDGNQEQIDYYVAFAIHYYGLIYSVLMEAHEPKRCKELKARSTRFYEDFIYWFANDGREVPFGRSLTYRYAHCAPFGAMAFAGLPIDYGVIKNLVLKNLETWMERPVFDNAGILTIGYGYPNLFMSENYNGCGSPYWCNKSFIVLGLGKEHPFWQAEPEVFHYQEKKLLKQARMIVTHDENHHVLAYVTGQHLRNNHGCGPEKYEKFVYSNQFGFSVSRGTTLESGAFDSALAVSLKGENHYCMRYGQNRFELDETRLFSSYEPIAGVKIETTIIPYSPWHVRIHKIINSIPVDLADSGFSIAREKKVEGLAEGGWLRFEKREAETSEDALFVRLPWGTSGVVSATGGTPELIMAAPNTNVLYNLTVIPTIKAAYEPGVHWMITSVFADESEEAKEKSLDRPEIEMSEEKIVVTYKGEVCEIEKKIEV